MLDDPRGIPYLFLWRTEDRPVSGVGEFAEAVRVAALPGGPPPVRPGEGWVSITRPAGQAGCVHALRLVHRPLPRNGGDDVLLLCPACEKPRRYLYAWEVIESRVFSRPWHCRTCAGLRYQSEGRGRNAWGPYPRYSWDPYVLSSLEKSEESAPLLSQVGNRDSGNRETQPENRAACSASGAAVKRYRCSRWPELAIGDRVRFRGGLFETADPELQTLVETRDYYGVHVLGDTDA